MITNVPFYKQKTTWTAIAAMVTAAGAYFTGEVQLQTVIETIFGSAMIIFMRQGVEKSK